MDAKSVQNMWSIIAVTNKHTAKLHHVGSLYILTYDARKLKNKKNPTVWSKFMFLEIPKIFEVQKQPPYSTKLGKININRFKVTCQF